MGGWLQRGDMLGMLGVGCLGWLGLAGLLKIACFEGIGIFW